jgi:hypothetical protein
MCRNGQAMVETVIAVLIITFAFLTLFKLSQLLTGKIMLEHAAMRVARARAVGFNDFMCRKAARVAVIPAAGKRIWPAGADELNDSMELARIAIYMNTPNAGVANAVMEYEGWRKLKVDPGAGDDSRVVMETDWFDLEGAAGIESNYQLFMNDQGL